MDIRQFDIEKNKHLPHFTIYGKLPSLNEYIAACRRNPHMGAGMKRNADNLIGWAVRKDLGKYKPTKPIILHFVHYEQNKRRDKDNINSYVRKSVLDALQKCGVIPNDGWAEVENFTQDYYIDQVRPRTEVYIEEVGKHENA